MPEHAVTEAERSGCPLPLVCAVLELETSGGRNVWGHDRTPVADDQLPYVKGGDVTERNYRAYLARRSEIGMQGVGPMQLTWHAYQDRADELGGCWRPEVNIRVGCEILASYLRTGATVRDAMSVYNTGGPGESPYATKGLPLLQGWMSVIPEAA